MKAEEMYEIVRQGNLVLHYCERFQEGSKKWDLTRHAHPYIELIFYLEGKASVEIGGYKVEPSIYDTLVYPAGWMHLDGVSGERRREIICLWVEAPGLEFERPLLLHDGSGTLGELFRMIYRERKEMEEENSYVMGYLLKLLLTYVIRCAETMGNSYGFMQKVLPYIHEHFAEKITLEELARLEHISVSYLSRRFKEYTGMTIVSYLNRLRIEEAKKLLSATNQAVYQVAYDTGFDDPKYFCRVFKDTVGEAPSEFRRICRGE